MPASLAMIAASTAFWRRMAQSKPMPAELSGQARSSPDAGMTPGFLKDDDVVHVRRKSVNLGDPRFREDGDPCPGPGLPDGGDGGERHDDVPDPVRPPDQHPFDPLSGEPFPASDFQLHPPITTFLIRKPGKNQLRKWFGRRDFHPDPQKRDLRLEIGEVGETDAVLLGGDDPGGAALRRETPEGLDIGTAVGMVVGKGLKGDDLRAERCQTPPEGLRRADSGESEYLLTLESRGG